MAEDSRNMLKIVVYNGKIYDYNTMCKYCVMNTSQLSYSMECTYIT
jgi:hypothetical protein